MGRSIAPGVEDDPSTQVDRDPLPGPSADVPGTAGEFIFSWRLFRRRDTSSSGRLATMVP
ncbi:MAG: hypothetical protein J2O38_04370 [Acidimicrobiales bacterium]|nr:hypothetical protein [Acidimicrobiales bacterium]